MALAVAGLDVHDQCHLDDQINNITLQKKHFHH